MSYRAESKRATFMKVAETIAGLGTCDRKQVGCVIVRDGRCISWGFNGAPPGLPHCDDNAHGWVGEWDRMFGEVRPEPGEEDRWYEFQVKDKGCRNATHAEANALAAAAKQGISTDNSILFTTCSPCDTCSRLLIAAGVKEVFYREEYRDRAGVELLERAGIIIEQL